MGSVVHGVSPRVLERCGCEGAVVGQFAVRGIRGMIGVLERRVGMKIRIAIWAGVGALVAVLWSLYIAGASPNSNSVLWILAYLTCPVALARHHALSFYFVLLANAATYALAGTIVETILRHHRQAHLISN